MNMQKRPHLHKMFHLQNQFIGKTVIGSWNVWINLGNYIDFQGGRNNLHKHSYFETCLVLDGEGDFYHGNMIYPLKKGDLFVADPLIIHEIVSSKTNHLKIQFVTFSFEKTSDNRTDESSSLIHQYISTFLHNHITVINDSENLDSLFQQLSIVSETRNREKRYLQSESITRNLVLNIILETVQEDVKGNGFPAIDNRLQTALHFIEDNSFRKLSVDEIARQACTSTRTLRRLIKLHYNKTIMQKCLEIRIKESARYLMAHPEQTVAEVSYRYGFENPSDFGRGFRQVLKVSPGKFREN
ncbi:MAG: helix-turn-helix transcriptional regulator [Spirochaetales bacterium]|nr:helix-turn-helix transcriptional regulator [Spirochaetales bacterium]